MKTKSIIESYYPTLTRAERTIADFIIGDEENSVMSMTLSEFSGRIKLGEATIVRFCRKINFTGYPDFKFAIALDAAHQEQSGLTGCYLDTIEKNIVTTINMTRKLMELPELERAAQMVTDARYLYLYGVCSSGFVAEMAEERFMRVGRHCKSIKDNHLQCSQSSISGPEDVIVVISISGTTSDLYEAVKIAKDNHCRLITVTNHINSPMAKLSDCVLLSCGKENPIEGGTLVSVTSQLFVIDALCTNYARLNTPDTNLAQEKVACAINKKLGRL